MINWFLSVIKNCLLPDICCHKIIMTIITHLKVFLVIQICFTYYLLEKH